MKRTNTNLAKQQRHETAAWIEEYVRNTPRASVKDIYRAAKKAGYEAMVEDIQRIRREVHLNMRLLVEKELKRREENVEAVVDALASKPRHVALQVQLPRELADELEAFLTGEAEEEEPVKPEETEREPSAVPCIDPVPEGQPAHAGGPPDWHPESPPEDEPEPAVEPDADAVPESPAPPEDARLAYVRERLEREPGVHPDILVAEMRQRFPYVMDRVQLYELCRAARDKHGLPQLGRRGPSTRRGTGGMSVDEHIQSLTREYVQGLKDAGYTFQDFALAFDADWQVEFTYELRRSSSGKMKL